MNKKRTWLEENPRIAEKRAAAEAKLRDCERRALAWLEGFVTGNDMSSDPALVIVKDAREARAEIEMLDKGDAHADRSDEG